VSATVLAFIAAGQMAFFVAVFLMLVAYRLADGRRKRRRHEQTERLARVMMDVLENRVPGERLTRVIERSRGNVVVTVLHQYASQMRGAPWERVVNAVRQSGWYGRFVRSHGRSRLWWKRLAAARLLSIAAYPEDLELARALVTDRHPAIKVAAIQVVRRIRDAAVLETVLLEAIAARPVVRRYLFDTVVSVREALVPVLAARLAAAGSTDELRALVTLAGELSAVEFFDRLVAYAGHESLEIRVAVARALSSYPHPRTEAALTVLLQDGEWQVRTQAASSLGVIRAVNARSALDAALRDGDWWVRLRAGIALRQLGPSGTEVLHDVQAGADRFAREMARYVLGLTNEAVADYLT